MFDGKEIILSVYVPLLYYDRYLCTQGHEIFVTRLTDGRTLVRNNYYQHSTTTSVYIYGQKTAELSSLTECLNFDRIFISYRGNRRLYTEILIARWS